MSTTKFSLNAELSSKVSRLTTSAINQGKKITILQAELGELLAQNLASPNYADDAIDRKIDDIDKLVESKAKNEAKAIEFNNMTLGQYAHRRQDDVTIELIRAENKHDKIMEASKGIVKEPSKVWSSWTGKAKDKRLALSSAFKRAGRALDRSTVEQGKDKSTILANGQTFKFEAKGRYLVATLQGEWL